MVFFCFNFFIILFFFCFGKWILILLSEFCILCWIFVEDCIFIFGVVIFFICECSDVLKWEWVFGGILFIGVEGWCCEKELEKRCDFLWWLDKKFDFIKIVISNFVRIKKIIWSFINFFRKLFKNLRFIICEKRWYSLLYFK